jgi:hypothetical protein
MRRDRRARQAPVKSLVRFVTAPTFANYSLAFGQMGDEFFTNVKIIRRVVVEDKLPFWSSVQAVAHFR